MPFAPQVRDATEAIQQVPTLVAELTDLLQAPAGWLVLAAFFFWLLVNKDFSHIFNVLERKERRRFEHLDLYVTKPELADEESVKVLRDLRDAHYFKIATGIYAEKRLRSALIALHNRTSHLVNWGQIRRAYPYINANDSGMVTIRELTGFERVSYWYNQFVGYTSLLLAAGILTLFFFSGSKTFTSLAWGVGGTLFVVFFALFVFAQNWPALAAKQIKRELAKLEPEEQGT